MAISDLLPRKTMESKTLAQTLSDRLDYDQKAEKTKDGALVSSFMCSPESAAEEFLISKQLYETITGRSQPKGRDIIMYRIIQSFKPGEIDPETANRIGYELAMRFTKGQHQFVVSTHTDRQHIHTHIEFNSTNLDCDGKFNNFKDSAFALRELSDALCRENGLSVIEKPKARGQRYEEKAAAKRGRSFKEKLRLAIENAIPASSDFEQLLARLREAGYEVKLGKHIAFRAEGQQNFTRAKTLGADYTEAALRKRIGGVKVRPAATGKTRPANRKKVNLLVDIQAKLQAGKGAGYERWAKIFNLKEAAKTLNFLTDSGITDYDELVARAEEAGEKFDTLSARIKVLEGRMGEVAQLKTHIINYSKTREVYAAFKKSRHKKEFRAEHETEIAQHEAAKAAFDALGGTKIPKVAELSVEYAALLSEKKERYEEYKTARKDMIAYQTAKQNIDRILGIEQEQLSHKNQEQDR